MTTNLTSVNLENSTAVTPPSSDNSTAVATTAWSLLGFAISLGTNGYIKFPAWLSGFMLQWGTAGGLADNSPTTVAFNTNFPNAAFAVVANDNGPNATSGNPRTMGCTITSTSDFTIEASGSGASAFWFAVGH
jgi:hypothetical protein